MGIGDEGLVENAATVGNEIVAAVEAMIEKYEFLKAVRGKGLMIAIDFGSPKSLSLKTAWNLLEAANKGLFLPPI